ARLSAPAVPVRHPNLYADARRLGGLVREFGLAVQWVLRHCGSIPTFLTSQYLHERIADAACDIYAASCTLSRLDGIFMHANNVPVDRNLDAIAGRHFLKLAFRRVRQNLDALTNNDDVSTTSAADAALRGH